MPIKPPEFDAAAIWLEPILVNLPPKTVAITGPLGAGKTTLARFLAWYFNISLIESDHYLIPHNGLACYSEEIERIIQFRHAIDRPVIVEGASILRLLSDIKKVPDAIIRVRNTNDRRRISAEERNLSELAKWGFEGCPNYEVSLAHHG